MLIALTAIRHLSTYADGFPRIRYFTVDDHFSILVMDLLGESLEKVFESCKRQFTVKTICHLGRQMVSLKSSQEFALF